MSFTGILRNTNNSNSSLGLYIGAHDPLGRMKMIHNARTAANTAGLRLVSLLEQHNTSDSAHIPYTIHWEAFDGGWWDAAQIYRQWVLEEAVWTQAGNLTVRPRAQQVNWTSTVPLWIVWHGDFP
eukprot:m.20794 g.20794  ORF g.20794 m.20794 type:complete len:125 (+) comp6952_c0_seq2:61-435(+)